jgi:microcystin-dependent protein
MSISQNTALFALLGTKYGGDGNTTFALPKLPGLTPAGPQWFIALAGEFPPSSQLAASAFITK